MSLDPPTAETAAGGGLHRDLAEFSELNRRRIFGSPPLSVAELERWLELRSGIEARFGAQDPDLWKGPEQREFLRLPTHIRIEYGAHGELEAGTLSDVSEGGLFIATDRPLDRNSPVRLVLAPAVSGLPVEITGSVAWVRESARDAGPAGMGIAFADLTTDARAAVANLIRKISEVD